MFALWTAPLAAPSPLGIQHISRVVVPEQEPRAGPRGPSVRVPGEELRRIAFDNYARGERCAVQIHTHPSADTRMSALGTKWEVVAHPGALSIIVPDYCRDGARSFWRASVYERGAGGRWALWGDGEILQSINVHYTVQDCDHAAARGDGEIAQRIEVR